eukprot:3753389-Lingulodinium_polyedra.AAC.1
MGAAGTAGGKTGRALLFFSLRFCRAAALHLRTPTMRSVRETRCKSGWADGRLCSSRGPHTAPKEPSL